MFWRILSIIILLFWAVMTGLIIRDSYFPEHSRFAEVPVSRVFDLFLNEAAAFNNTLDVYHVKQKLGHITFTIKKLDEQAELPVYAMLVNGSVQVLGEKESFHAGFSCMGELVGAETWRRFKVDVKAPAAEMEAKIVWKLGDDLPDIEVKKQGQVVMNTQMAKAMLGMKDMLGGESSWLLKMMPTEGAPAASAFRLTAREGKMDLAGKSRRCYIVQLKLIQGYEVNLYFSELGELARVDLPQGYRLIEPMMHGLEPGLKTLE